MALLGKIIGGVAGFAVGGPIGALIGLVAGHGYDASRDAVRAKKVDIEDLQSVFLVGVIALAAKMAKADGLVERSEIQILRTMLAEEASRPDAARIYNEAKRSADGYEAYAEQVAERFRRHPSVLLEALDILWAVAMADGQLHPVEERMLAEIARIFRLPKAVARMVRARHLAHKKEHNEKSDLEILGLASSADNDTIRSTYRQLVRDNHPDRLVAQGMAEEFVEQANDRLKAINAAYDRIAKRRGM